jgi:DNA mismatch repair ATPase MutS
MKAFLMHKDRDFDPEQLLIRREREQRFSRSSDRGLRLQQALPWNADALTRDLELNVLFNAMANGDRFLFEVAQLAVLSGLTELGAIRFRQHILADSLNNPTIVREIYRIAMEAIEGERKNYWSSFGRYPTGTLHRAVDVLRMLVGALKKLRQIAEQDTARFDSVGYSRLFAMLRMELSDEYFNTIERHLKRLDFRRGTLVSARLGKGNKGQSYVLRKPSAVPRNWLVRLMGEKPQSYMFRIHPRDEAGARALSALNDRGVNLVANALAQSTDHILSFFQMLRTELAFYIGCLNLQTALGRIDEPVCFPAPAPLGQRKLSSSGLYDPSLALAMGRKVVGNDLDFNRSDLLIITGANTGGKSTFLRSAGIAQLMMQAGMFVAAEAYSSEMCSGVITHYRREEDAAMESGKWDEELRRMSEIVDKVRPNSLLLFNESFASTNEREGSEIANQIVGALVDSGVKVCFVTHLYHFANSCLAERSDRAIFLRAERRPDGSRSFKLVQGKPLQTSYGEDLYKRVFSASELRQEDAAVAEDSAAAV